MFFFGQKWQNIHQVYLTAFQEWVVQERDRQIDSQNLFFKRILNASVSMLKEMNSFSALQLIKSALKLK